MKEKGGKGREILVAFELGGDIAIVKQQKVCSIEHTTSEKFPEGLFSAAMPRRFVPCLYLREFLTLQPDPVIFKFIIYTLFDGNKILSSSLHVVKRIVKTFPSFNFVFFGFRTSRSRAMTRPCDLMKFSKKLRFETKNGKLPNWNLQGQTGETAFSLKLYL